MQNWLSVNAAKKIILQTKSSISDRVFCCPSKTVSRILYYVIICLCQKLLFGYGELLLTEFRDVFNPIFCFVLAPNKDLAVSLPSFNWNRPVIRQGASTFRFRRFCSHLAHYCGRLLAAIILSALNRARWCSDFPLLISYKEQSLILLRHHNITKFQDYCQGKL